MAVVIVVPLLGFGGASAASSAAAPKPTAIPPITSPATNTAPAARNEAPQIQPPNPKTISTGGPPAPPTAPAPAPTSSPAHRLPRPSRLDRRGSSRE